MSSRLGVAPEDGPAKNSENSVNVADMKRKDNTTTMPHAAHISPSSDLSDEDLERYLLGRIPAGEELAEVEDHLIRCPSCAERAEAMTDPIAALIRALQRFEGEDAVISH